MHIKIRLVLVATSMVLATLSCDLPRMSEARGAIKRIPQEAGELAPSLPDIRTLVPQNLKTVIPEDLGSYLTAIPNPLSTNGEVISLWAADATASSSYGSTDWSPQQALMAPDTFECGDMVTAWASGSNNMVEWLELSYAVPVYASSVIIYQTYNPSQVTRVDLIEPNGQSHQVYQAQPVDHRAAPCPYQTIINLDPPVDYPVEKVRITVDQSVLGLGWAEIDAVELQGIQVTNLYPEASTLDPGMFATNLPLPAGAQVIAGTGELITYKTTLTLSELMRFYRNELEAQGYAEDDSNTVTFSGGFSMAFKNSSGDEVIIQATNMAGADVVVVIRRDK